MSSPGRFNMTNLRLDLAVATLQRNELLATLEQILRLSREADRTSLDVATMLGDIARAAITKAGAL